MNCREKPQITVHRLVADSDIEADSLAGENLLPVDGTEKHCNCFYDIEKSG
jgi:hypothetical protein